MQQQQQSAAAPITATSSSNSVGISMSSAPVSLTLTIDELADEFLSSSRGGGTNALPPTALLYPHPPALPGTIEASSSNLERLQWLVSHRAYADVVTLAHRLCSGSDSHYAALYQAIIASGMDGSNANTTTSSALAHNVALQTHKDELVYILTVLLQALVKLKRSEEISDMLDRWNFLHHNNTTHSNENNRTMTLLPVAWIPWSLHIAGAVALRHSSKNTAPSRSADNDGGHRSDQCLDALWAIRADIIASTENNNNKEALYQVEQALANVLVQDREWRLALQCLQRMIDIDAEVPGGGSKQPKQQRAVELLSRQGRVLLQAGAVDQAAIVMEQARAAAAASTSSGSEADQARLLVNDGLLHFSCSRHDSAMVCFQQASELLRSSNPNNSIVNSVGDEQLLYSEAMNNWALCALYTCRLHDALTIMESLVRENVTAYLTDRVALNLCTLYELASDSTISGRKKRVLQLIAQRFALHDIGPECFRVSN
jgi:tetratricopeptide (TPR) repeat protein